MSEDAAGWVAPLVCHRWPGYEVRFEGYTRGLDEAYAAVTSERFGGVVSAAVLSDVGSALLLGAEATRVGRTRVTLSDGRELSGRMVVDARGPERMTPGGTGYQKFVGMEVRLENAHGLDRPVVMDATVDQSEGFHFFYLLPFSEKRLLIEDTYFNESPALDPAAVKERIREYAAGKGYVVNTVVREETGVLPMPWTAAPDAHGGGFRAGYAGGWFHPGTGYSFPVAVRLADAISRGGTHRIRAHPEPHRTPCAGAQEPVGLLPPPQPSALSLLPARPAPQRIRTLLPASAGDNPPVLRAWSSARATVCGCLPARRPGVSRFATPWRAGVWHEPRRPVSRPRCWDGPGHGRTGGTAARVRLGG